MCVPGCGVFQKMTDAGKEAETVYLSLGSNLGDRAAHLSSAIGQLSAVGRVTRVSSLYETQPVSEIEQPWFLNCAAILDTEHAPRDLLRSVLAIEAGMGRLRFQEKGPRKIDIDILLFGNRVIEETGLQIPHPTMHQRRFVLEPLAEIAPQVRHPVLGKTAVELLSVVGTSHAVRRLQDAGILWREQA